MDDHYGLYAINCNASHHSHVLELLVIATCMYSNGAFHELQPHSLIFSYFSHAHDECQCIMQCILVYK